MISEGIGTVPVPFAHTVIIGAASRRSRQNARRPGLGKQAESTETRAGKQAENTETPAGEAGRRCGGSALKEKG